MVLKKNQISPQYLSRNQIITTILDIISPAHYVVKECPSRNSSSQARDFAEAEDSMQKYYESIEPCFFQMPVKDSIVVVLHKGKFYRACVISILALSVGHLFKVYLLDYGKECSVPRDCLFEIKKDFLAHPFQAVHFKLLGIEPISLVVSPLDLSVSYGPVSEWDDAAVRHIQGLQKVMCSSYIEVKAVDEKFLYGNLYMTFGDASIRCVNDELVEKKYASFNEDCWKNVLELDPAAARLNSGNERSPVSTVDQHSSSTLEVPKFEDFNVKFLDTDGRVVGESSLMNDSIPSSEITHKNVKQMNQTTIELGKSVPSHSRNIQTSNKSPAESNKKLLMLQKLHRQKQSLSSGRSAECDIFRKSPSLVTETKHQSSNTSTEDSSLKESMTNLKIFSDDSLNTTRTKNMNFSDNECDKINLSGSFSDKSKKSNITNQVRPSKQDSTRDTTEVSPNLKKLQMLHKLKEMKQSPLQQSPDKTGSLNKDEENKIKSPNFTKSTTSNSDTLSVSPRKSVSSPDSTVLLSKEDSSSVQKYPVESPPRQQVDFKKVKQFYKMRQLNQSSSASQKLDNTISTEREKQVHKKPTEQSCAIAPTDVSTSNVSVREKSEPETCFTKCSESEFCAGDFITCSSPKTPEKVNSDSRSKAIVTSDFISPRNSTNANISHSNSSKDSDDLILGNLTMSPPLEHLDSEILKTLSDTSDSDDILHMYTRKQNESFSDKSDGENFDIKLCTQLEQFESKQLMDFSQSKSLWEKQKVPVLQIGESLPSPILCVEEAPFSPELHKVLKEIKFYGPSCIQSVVWPAFIRTRSLVAIAPPHSGKTVAYVMPIVSYYMEQEGSLPKGNGPIHIILCSSWKKVQAVNEFFHFFLGTTKVKIVTLCADGGQFRYKVQSLINGCDILIATPFCLLNFFKINSVSFFRCLSFILDDGSTLITENKKQLKYLLLHFLNGIKPKIKGPQLVVCAERWNKDFQIIMDKIMSRPLLFFTSFLESAIFAHIPIFGHVCDPNEKMQAVLDVLKDSGKVVICTSNAEDAEDIHHFLRCEDKRSYLVTEQMEHYIADEVLKDWKSARCMNSSHCLITTDQSLIRMCISNADCLIHYDVPHESRLQFGNRFSCIAEHFQKEEDSQKCECHIFITKSDYRCATYLIDIIESAGGKVPTELKTLAEMENKVENTSDLLCKYMKAFGFCKERHCEHRHYIDPVLDKPRIIPCEGDIQGLVTEILDASHYYVRLQKYLDVETNKTISFIAAYAEVGFKLKDFYSSGAEELEVETPVIGENYVLVEENVLFYRIKVLEKVNPASYTEFPKWKILFLDEGWIKCYEKLKLFKLTDQIQIPSFLAYEVYLCNVLTPDSSRDWNPQATRLISGLIKGREIYGKIVLCLGNTLWLDPIVLRAQLHGINDYINQMKVHKKLIDSGHAKENNCHLKMLHDACVGKVPLPRIIKHNIKAEEEKQEESPASYAFLNCGVYEDVYVSSVISPERLYVQRAKFVQCLDDLLDKINSLIERRILKKCSTFFKGMQCIAPFQEDGRYYRAVLTDFPSDNDVQLFFVDFGDTGKAFKKDIFHLPPEFLLLPFQAIECELAGIAAAHGGWTDSAVDTLYSLTRDDAGDMKILQLKAYCKKSSYEGGNHYVIDLWWGEKCLSEQLLLAGFGIPNEIPSEDSHNYSGDKAEGQENDESFDFDDECSSSDEDAHPEVKDAAALFCGVLSNMMLQACGEIPNTAATITEITSDEENPIRKPSDTNISNNLDNLNLENDLTINNIEGDVLSTLKTDSNKPLITWWDTPQQLSVLINLKEVKVYHLDVTDEGFNFNTIVAGIHYVTEEQFFAKIESSTATKYQNAQGINIVAKKQTPFKWPRLVQGKKKFLHIKYDLIHIDDSDSDETSRDANNNGNIIKEESTSSSDEDDYCQPWKEVGKYKDPYNLLE